MILKIFTNYKAENAYRRLLATKKHKMLMRKKWLFKQTNAPTSNFHSKKQPDRKTVELPSLIE